MTGGVDKIFKGFLSERPLCLSLSDSRTDVGSGEHGGVVMLSHRVLTAVPDPASAGSAAAGAC